jgi:hypothetical protein
MRRSFAKPLPTAMASRLLTLLLALALGLAGCGDSVPSAGALRPVKGKVVFSKPEAFAGLKVEFIPNAPTARPATGELKPDGSFELTTTTPGDGIAEGDYKVRLVRPAGVKGKPAASPIPAPYFDEDGSYLSATIKSDTAELPPFDLKPVTAKSGSTKGPGGRSAD